MSVYFSHHVPISMGTFPLKAEELSQAVEHAVEAGYCGLDTAQMYEMKPL